MEEPFLESFRTRLRRRLGLDVDPEVTLREEPAVPAPTTTPGSTRPPSTTSSKILERLSSRGLGTSRYRIEGELARGGMGAILKVWDEDLRRTLAMKVALERGAGERAKADALDPEMLARFLEEAQITGQLDHPGIVPVHELGLGPAGDVYFTMRLVRGRDLAQVFRQVARGEDGWTVTRALGVLAKACEAMAYAHSKGVIHRDLKPANVMVGRFGEVYVMDWGLARVLDALDGDLSPHTAVRSEMRDDDSGNPLATIDGQVFGTPAYMSPEQARGEVRLLTARTDVYAMGAMLYHLLTGTMPYRHGSETVSPLDILERLEAGPPASLLELEPDAPPELVAIVEKAMAREPWERYDDMAELSADLSAFLEHRVVRAYRTGPVQELRKWVGRNRGMAAALAALVLAVVGGLASTTFVHRRANETLAASNAELQVARDEARAEERRASAAAERAAAEAASRRAVADFLTGMFELADPDRARGRTITVKEVLDTAARDIDAGLGETPEVRAQLAGTMGTVYRSLGLYDEAAPLLRASLELARGRDGDAAASTQRAQLTWIELLIEQGRYDEAEAELERLFAERVDELVEPQRARVALARVLEDTGRRDVAIATLTEALAGFRAAGREDEPEALEAASTLIDLTQERTLDVLVPEREGLIERAEAAFGPDHPTTLALRERLADTLRGAADFAGAEPIFDDVLARRRRVLGPEHPDTLATADQLAYLYLAVGRSQAAIELYAETLAAVRDVLGPEHHDVLIVQNKYASALRDAGRVEEALTMFQETVDGFAANFGEQHPGTGAALNNLGLTFQALGRFAEAEAVFQRALPIRASVWGADSYQALQTENNLGLVYRSTGRQEEALAIALRVHDGYARMFGPEHPETLTTLDNLGVVYYYLGRYDEAVETVGEAARVGRAALGNAHPLVGRFHNNLGAILMQLERWDEAIEALLASYEGYAEVYGPDHPEAVKALGHLGKIHLRFGRHDEAEECYRRYYEAAQATYGDAHPATYNALNLLAGIQLATGRSEPAEASFRAASLGFAAVYGADHPATTEASFGRADALIRLERESEAHDLLDELDRLLPADDERRATLDGLRERLE